MDGKQRIVTILPIKLNLHGFADKTQQVHIFTLCLVFTEESFLMQLNNISISKEFLKGLVYLGPVFVAFMVISYIASFRLAHNIMRPLRVLNLRMRDVITEGMKRELEVGK